MNTAILQRITGFKSVCILRQEYDFFVAEADLEVQRSCGRGPLLAIKQFNVEKILRRLSNTVQVKNRKREDIKKNGYHLQRHFICRAIYQI